MKLSEIHKAQTLEDLERLMESSAVYEIDYRGGNLGFSGIRVAELIGVDVNLLPRNFGAYCNYLGGGVRGSICCSGFSQEIKGARAEKLKSLAEACARAYKNLEDEQGLNEGEYPDGDTNWDAQATKAARRSGTESAY